MSLPQNLTDWWRGYTPADRESLIKKMRDDTLTPGEFIELMVHEFAALMASHAKQEEENHESEQRSG